MVGNPKLRKGKFQFSLRTLMVFTALIALVLAFYINRAKRAKMQRRLRNSVVIILQGAYRHEAVRQHALLRELQIVPAGSSCSAGFLNSWQFVIGSSNSSFRMQSVEKRSDWPIEKVQQAVLSGLVEAIADADLLTSAKMEVTDRLAILTGDEGQITWEVISAGRGVRSKATGPYRLKLKISCQGEIDFGRRTTIPRAFKFGEYPELALLSKDAEDRLAGAHFIYLQSDPNQLERMFDAIAIETDPRVMSRLFRRLEATQPFAVPGVLPQLLTFMEQGHTVAPLAARTILRSYGLGTDYRPAVRGPTNTAILSHLRRASIDILKNGDDRKHWGRAIDELLNQKDSVDKEVVDALVHALGKGGSEYQIGQILRSNGYAYNRLFEILAQSEQTKVWFVAAEILMNDPTFKFADGQTIWQRRAKLDDLAQRRIQLGGGWQGDFAVFGDDPFEFLSQFVGYDVQKNVSRLSRKSCYMLVQLGDPRAVPVFAQAFEEQYQQGMFDDPSSSWYAIGLVKAINELTGENIGELGIGLDVSGAETEAADWTEIRKTLTEKFGTTTAPESAIKAAAD